MEPAAPKQSDRFSMGRMFVVLTVVAVALGLAAGTVRWINLLIMNVERDAARQRILERGSETAYDRQLLGNEVDKIKAEYKKRNNE